MVIILSIALVIAILVLAGIARENLVLKSRLTTIRTQRDKLEKELVKVRHKVADLSRDLFNTNEKVNHWKDKAESTGYIVSQENICLNYNVPSNSNKKPKSIGTAKLQSILNKSELVDVYPAPKDSGNYNIQLTLVRIAYPKKETISEENTAL